MNEEELIRATVVQLAPEYGPDLVTLAKAEFESKAAPIETRSIAPEHLHCAADVVVIFRFLIATAPIVIAAMKKISGAEAVKAEVIKSIWRPSSIGADAVEKIVDTLIEKNSLK